MIITGAIFDIDGTLIDSMKIWDNLGERYLLKLGIQPENNLQKYYTNDFKKVVFI